MKNNTARRIGAHLCILVLCIVGFSSCGRKQRTIFSFEEKSVVHVNKLAFPAVRGIQTELHQPDGIYIHWDPVSGSFAYNASLVGYNVYKVTNKHCIHKTPLNKKPLIHPYFWDRRKPPSHGNKGYIVRAIFSVKGTRTTGPASALATCSF